MKNQPDPKTLREAARDLRYLLSRGYPKERALGLVGDRHALPVPERELLRRGVCAEHKARQRMAKRIKADALAGRALALDGHNVLITLESALAERPLVLADDGFVRDISGLGRHHRPGPDTARAIELMLDFMGRCQVGEARIYLDAPLSKSGEMAAELRRLLAERNLKGDAQALPVPETALAAHAGPVASSDRAVIDQVEEPVDLAGEIIMSLLHPAPALTRLS